MYPRISIEHIVNSPSAKISMRRTLLSSNLLPLPSPSSGGSESGLDRRELGVLGTSPILRNEEARRVMRPELGGFCTDVEVGCREGDNAGEFRT